MNDTGIAQKASSVPAWVVACAAILGMALTAGSAINQTAQNTKDIATLRSEIARKDVEDERWSDVQNQLTEIKAQIRELAKLR